MQRALKLFADLLLRPFTMAAVEQRVSWAATWGFLAALAIASALTILLTVPEIQPHPALWPFALSFLAGCLFALLVGPTALVGVLVRFGVRVQGHRLPFPWLFLVITWAGVPALLLAFVSLSIAQINWYTRHTSYLLDCIGLFWWAALVSVALRSRLRVSSVRTCFALVPAVLFSVGLETVLWIYESPAVQTAARWQSLSAPNATLCHTGAADAQVLLHDSVKILDHVRNLLDVRAPAHKLEVFIFEDARVYKRVMGEEEYYGAAHLDEKFVTVLRTEPKDMRCTIVHEIAHFVVHERIAQTLPALLQEGIATYAEREIGQCDVDADAHVFTNGLSLKALVDDTHFYEGETSINYAHAAAFVSGIIKDKGLPRFKDFCRFISDRTHGRLIADIEEIFLQAFRTIYGTELSDWEEAWKAKRQPNQNAS